MPNSNYFVARTIQAYSENRVTIRAAQEHLRLHGVPAVVAATLLDGIMEGFLGNDEATTLALRQKGVGIND